MPAPTPGLGEFIRKNASESLTGKTGKAFIAFDVVNLVTSEKKIKSIWQLFKDLVLLKPIIAAGFLSLFLGMSKAVRSLVHDTGSLEAALKKLTQIQGLQKMFTGMVGGAEAAKLKVAELVNFAATRNIKLGDAAEATRSLELMTKGAFSTVKALDVINDTAKATGNGVVEMADAVGAFHAALQEGGIESATESLRQMGAINDNTAESLIRLQKNGATTGQIFDALTDSFNQFNGGASDATESIDGVNEAFEKAAVNLQSKFGSPFVEDDVTNTKNYTDAMVSLAPTVERMGKFLNALTGGFSTVKSKVAATVADWKLTQVAIESVTVALGSLVAVGAILGSGSLVNFFRNLSASVAKASAGVTAETILASKGMNTFGNALSFIGVSGKATEATLTKTSGWMAKLTGWAPKLVGALRLIPLAFAGATIGSAINKWISSFEEAAIALQKMQKGEVQANALIIEQIKNVRTLADMHDAITAALNRETEARKEWAEAIDSGDKAQIESAEASLKRSEITSRKALAINPNKLGPTPEESTATIRDIQRGRDEEEARFQAKLAAARPSDKAALQQQHIEKLSGTIGRGERSEEETRAFSRTRQLADNAVAASAGILSNEQLKQEAAQKKLDAAQARLKAETKQDRQGFDRPVDAKFTNAVKAAQEELEIQKKIVQEEKQKLDFRKDSQAKVGETARLGSTTEIRSRLLKNELSNDPDKAEKAALIERELQRALIEEREAGENRLARIREQAAAKEEARALMLSRLEAQRGLDLQEAEAKGDSRAVQRIQDLSVFASKLQELRDAGFGEDEAAKAAAKFAENAVAISGQQSELNLNSATVSDSLTRIGGGGGVYAPGGDATALMKRQIELHTQEVDYLKTIATTGSQGVL